MINEFKKNNVNILKVYHCPHTSDENCNCRKPKIGMIQQSLNDFDIDLENSWLIGDKKSDIETAINANTIFFIDIDVSYLILVMIYIIADSDKLILQR